MEVYLNLPNKKNWCLYGEWAVTAKEGSSGLGVLLGLPPLFFL
jgi:hypothetical protein